MVVGGCWRGKCWATAKVEMLCLVGKTACLLFLAGQLAQSKLFRELSPDSGCEAMKEQGEGEGGGQEEEEQREGNWEGRTIERIRREEKEEEKREVNWEGRKYFEGKSKEELRCSQCGRRKEKIILLRPLPREQAKTFGGGVEKGSSTTMMMHADQLQLQGGGKQVEKQERRKKESGGSSFETSGSHKSFETAAEKRQVGIFYYLVYSMASCTHTLYFWYTHLIHIQC